MTDGTGGADKNANGTRLNIYDAPRAGFTYRESP
jgi:hypothetical protein